MALTAEDVQCLREMVEDVITQRVDPWFDKLEGRSPRVSDTDHSFENMQKQINAIQADIQILREDSAGVTGLVKDHSVEIARLKHRPA